LDHELGGFVLAILDAFYQRLSKQPIGQPLAKFDMSEEEERFASVIRLNVPCDVTSQICAMIERSYFVINGSQSLWNSAMVDIIQGRHVIGLCALFPYVTM
jgi:hypothetical protein